MPDNLLPRTKTGLLSIAGTSMMLAHVAAEVAEARRRHGHRRRWASDEQSSDEDLAQKGQNDAYGGRRLERLRDKAGANHNGAQDDQPNISVSTDPATGQTTVGTHNITFTTGGDGSVNALTSGIAFDRAADPVVESVQPPIIGDDGGVTPVPEPGDTPPSDGGNVPNPNQPTPTPGTDTNGGEPISPLS